MKKIRDMPLRYQIELLRLIGAGIAFIACYVFIAKLA